MNKQEAIESLKKMAEESFEIAKTHAVYIDSILEVIEEIHGPQKVVVPKFVAEWYEIYKNDLDPAIYNIITRTYKKVNGENNDLLDTFETWFVYEDNSILTLVKMYLFGYEIEKEKLYTVEIPDPNSHWAYTFLTNKGPGVYIDMTDGDLWKDASENQLTEAEIKKDFEWAWQWAKEVEV